MEQNGWNNAKVHNKRKEQEKKLRVEAGKRVVIFKKNLDCGIN